jgi:predicted methyltransferase
MRTPLLPRIFGTLTLIAMTTSAFAGMGPDTKAALDAALSGEQRSDENRARDGARHPRETLEFFGFRSDMTVVELWAGGGWYTEILAPALRESGRLIATTYGESDDPTAYRNRSHRMFMERVEASPEVFDKVEVRSFWPPEDEAMAKAGSADMVVTFRNIHSMTRRGQQEAVFAAAYAALKPGGVLGVVQHRAPEGVDPIKNADKGYIPESFVIGLAEAAGFRLDGKSEINANPKDTKDYPGGVWTLPPRLRSDDVDKSRFIAIGESDRMTLRFVKPAD